MTQNKKEKRSVLEIISPVKPHVFAVLSFIFVVFIMYLFTTCHTHTISTETKEAVNEIKQESLNHSDSINHVVLNTYHKIADLDTEWGLTTENMPSDIKRYFQEKDSLYLSLFSHISKQHNWHLDRVIADARQDYNDQINNLNNWIAIWVAVLCGISIILPLILGNLFKDEYKQKQKELDEKIKKAERSVEKVSRMLDNKIKRAESSVERIADEEKIVECTFNIMAVLDCIKSMKEVSNGFFSGDHWQTVSKLLDHLKVNNDIFAVKIKELRYPNDVIKNETIIIYLIRYEMLLIEFETLLNTNYALVGLTFLNKLKEHLKKINDSIVKRLSDDNLSDLSGQIGEISEYIVSLKQILGTQYKVS